MHWNRPIAQIDCVTIIDFLIKNCTNIYKTFVNNFYQICMGFLERMLERMEYLQKPLISLLLLMVLWKFIYSW